MRRLKKTAGLSYREAALYVDCLLEAIVEGLASGERIELRGFGSFRLLRVAQKNYPSLRWSDSTLVPAHSRIIFRPSRGLKKSVWGKGAEAAQ
jgi:integration host factor subunit beta